MRKMKLSIPNLQSAVCNARTRERGQALVEYAIIFPLQLLLTLTIIQLAHIFVAKQVLEYAAFCGARAKLVGLADDDAKTAGMIPLSRITGLTVLPGTVLPSQPVYIPGWNPIAGPGAGTNLTGFQEAWYKTRNWTAGPDTDNGTPIVRCDINEYDYELSVPMGNFVASKLGALFTDPNVFDWTTYGTPHLKMQAHCRLAQPWAQ
jgi:hypothetical protein